MSTKNTRVDVNFYPFKFTASTVQIKYVNVYVKCVNVHLISITVIMYLN